MKESGRKEGIVSSTLDFYKLFGQYGTKEVVILAALQGVATVELFEGASKINSGDLYAGIGSLAKGVIPGFISRLYAGIIENRAINRMRNSAIETYTQNPKL